MHLQEVEELVVLIKGKRVDLAYVKSSRDKIYNHLMKAVDFKGQINKLLIRLELALVMTI
jgi:hypothetical protein